MNEKILFEKNNNEKQMIPYFNYLKCIAMLAVVGIHVLAPTINSYSNHLSYIQFSIALFLHSFLSLWGVPIFVMISGALFLNPTKKISIKKIYGKYILRLVLVLLSFGTLYAIMELFFTSHNYSVELLFLGLKNVYIGNLWDHMWFIYMLIGLYIVTPILKKVIFSADVITIRYFLLILFIFTCFIPLLDSIVGIKFAINIPITSVWLFYYILGYALHFGIININYKLCLFFIFIGMSWCSFGQLIPNTIMINNYEYSLKYALPTDIFGIISSIGIFLVSKKIFTSEKQLIIQFMHMSFGIYVIHPIFINFIYKVLLFTPNNYNTYIIWIITFFVTSICSFITVYLLRLIPFIRKWIL